MTPCEVTLTGTDGKPYPHLVDATSVFDAADRAVRANYRTWWFDPSDDAIIRVKRLDEGREYRVRLARVRASRAK